MTTKCTKSNGGLQVLDTAENTYQKEAVWKDGVEVLQEG